MTTTNDERRRPTTADGDERRPTTNDDERRREGFSACWNDRAAPGGEGSKKRGTLNVVTQLCKIYFKLNTLRLCHPLLRPIEAASGKASETARDRERPRACIALRRRLCDAFEGYRVVVDDARRTRIPHDVHERLARDASLFRSATQRESTLSPRCLARRFRLRCRRPFRPAVGPPVRPAVLCVAAAQSGALDKRGMFAQGDLVTYKFYVGRLRMFEDQYVEAERHLSYALAHCHRGPAYAANKRRVAPFRVPLATVDGGYASSGVRSPILTRRGVVSARRRVLMYLVPVKVREDMRHLRCRVASRVFSRVARLWRRVASRGFSTRRSLVASCRVSGLLCVAPCCTRAWRRAGCGRDVFRLVLRRARSSHSALATRDHPRMRRRCVTRPSPRHPLETRGHDVAASLAPSSRDAHRHHRHSRRDAPRCFRRRAPLDSSTSGGCPRGGCSRSTASPTTSVSSPTRSAQATCASSTTRSPRARRASSTLVRGAAAEEEPQGRRS